jgi:hypothetical protein
MPPLHYWNRILSSDVFVVLDNAQYVRKGWQNQMFLRDKHGNKLTLFLPVKHTGERFAINEARIDMHHKWPKKHLRTIEMHYARAPYYDSYRKFIEWMYGSPQVWRGRYASFYEYVRTGIVHLLRGALKYDGKIIESSGMNVNGKASEWMLNISRSLGATTYLCGGVAYENYMDIEAFEKAGIEIEVQDWKCPEYPQQGEGFVSNLSILDLLLNVGEETAMRILK